MRTRANAGNTPHAPHALPGRASRAFASLARGSRTRPSLTAARPIFYMSAGTMGAAFAVYWLMRIGIDGERGFCFGVNAAWKPNLPPLGHGPPEGSFFAMDPAQRRLAFYYKAPWAMLNQLMASAGCLVPATSTAGAPAQTSARRASLAVKKTIDRVSASTRSVLKTSTLNFSGLHTHSPKPSLRDNPASAPRFTEADRWKVDVERTRIPRIATRQINSKCLCGATEESQQINGNPRKHLLHPPSPKS